MVCIAHGKNTVEKTQFKKQGKETSLKLHKFFKINNKEMIQRIKNYQNN
jgi:hypothetical protein